MELSKVQDVETMKQKVEKILDSPMGILVDEALKIRRLEIELDDARILIESELKKIGHKDITEEREKDEKVKSVDYKGTSSDDAVKITDSFKKVVNDKIQKDILKEIGKKDIEKIFDEKISFSIKNKSEFSRIVKLCKAAGIKITDAVDAKRDLKLKSKTDINNYMKENPKSKVKELVKDLYEDKFLVTKISYIIK